MTHQWYDDWQEVCRLGRWLVSERNFTGAELIAAMEKPHNWTHEYYEMRREEANQTDLCTKETL